MVENHENGNKRMQDRDFAGKVVRNEISIWKGFLSTDRLTLLDCRGDEPVYKGLASARMA